MAEVICTDEFAAWFDSLTTAESESVMNIVHMLEIAGINLGAPYSSAILGARYALRELRPKQGRSPLRIVYAFDPRRDAVLLIGGNKGKEKRFYKRIIEEATRIWEQYLQEQATGLHD